MAADETQEKEIKWLKQALDESVQVSLSQPQIQSQVEVLQSQAKQSHSELTKVLQQAEELKTLNASLAAKLAESENVRKSLQSELEVARRERSVAQSQLAKESQVRSERDLQLQRISEQMKEAANVLEQKDSLLRQKKAESDLLEAQNKELTEKNRVLESERFANKHRYLTLKEKVVELEAEKQRLTDKLESSVGSLEAVMADKLRQMQKQLQEAADKIVSLQEENKKLDQRHQEKDELIKQERQRLQEVRLIFIVFALYLVNLLCFSVDY